MRLARREHAMRYPSAEYVLPVVWDAIKRVRDPAGPRELACDLHYTERGTIVDVIVRRRETVG